MQSAIGLDVHSKILVACHLTKDDETGKDTHEFGTFSTFKTGLEELAKWVVDRGNPPVMMESTNVYWMMPRKVLMKHGIKCVVVNARHIKNVPGHKTDFADSLWLAMVCRSGLVKNSFMPTPEFEQIRRITRLRQQMTGDLGRSKNRVHKCLAQSGVNLSNVISDIHGESGRAMLEAMLTGVPPIDAARFANHRIRATKEQLQAALDVELDENDLFILSINLERVKEQEAALESLDAQLEMLLAPYQWAVDLLSTIPGVDFVAAASILAEIGLDMEEFQTPDRLASWAGMCPGNHESAGKRKAARATNGNSWIRRILCEVANCAVRTKNCYLSEKFKTLSVRRGRKRAIVAIGHNILRVIYYMLKRKEPYKDRLTDYQNLVIKRNAPRWIKKLAQLGYVVIKTKTENAAEASEPASEAKPKTGRKPKAQLAAAEAAEPASEAKPRRGRKPKAQLVAAEAAEPASEAKPKRGRKTKTAC
jgi:transposase